MMLEQRLSKLLEYALWYRSTDGAFCHIEGVRAIHLSPLISILLWVPGYDTVIHLAGPNRSRRSSYLSKDYFQADLQHDLTR